jgi:hypothetical protein
MVRRRRGEGECPRGEDRLGCDREAVDPESIRVERTPPTPQADIESGSTAKRSARIRVGAVGSVCVRETQRLSLTLEISAGSPANPVNTDTNDAVLGECTELLTAPSLLPTDLN